MIPELVSKRIPMRARAGAVFIGEKILHFGPHIKGERRKE